MLNKSQIKILESYHRRLEEHFNETNFEVESLKIYNYSGNDNVTSFTKEGAKECQIFVHLEKSRYMTLQFLVHPFQFHPWPLVESYEDLLKSDKWMLVQFDRIEVQHDTLSNIIKMMKEYETL